jgi:CubicO group peptidase (beta-lactamase class C family)
MLRIALGSLFVMILVLVWPAVCRAQLPPGPPGYIDPGPSGGPSSASPTSPPGNHGRQGPPNKIWVVDEPRNPRPTSSGNGLFYDQGADHDLDIFTFAGELQLRQDDGFRPLSVNAYYDHSAPPGFLPVEFAVAYLEDDDSSFPHKADEALLALEFSALFDAYQLAGARPLSVSGYFASSSVTNFAVSWIQDEADFPTQLILDKTAADYAVDAAQLKALNFRPLSVSGYSWNGGTPRFSAIWIRDGIQGWESTIDLPAEDLQDYTDQWVGVSYQPIHMSGYMVGPQQYFTTVFVGEESGAHWAGTADMTEATYLSQMAYWTTPALNPQLAVHRPLAVAAYPTLQGKRYIAIWKSTAPKTFRTTGAAVPELSLFDSTVEQFMKDRDITGAALCVAKDGETVLLRGYTWAPPEWRDTRPNDGFRIASVSKPLTAVGTLKLLDQGIIVGIKSGGLQQLSLDTEYFDIVGMPDPPPQLTDSGRITIRDLLRHTAYFTYADYAIFLDDHYISGALGTQLPNTRQTLIDYIETPVSWPIALDPVSMGYVWSFLPMPSHTYANTNYLLLAELIDEFSGTTYEDWIRTQVLQPVGANLSRLGQTERVLAYEFPREVTYSAKAHYETDTVTNTSDATVSQPNGHVMGNTPWLPTGPTRPYGRYNVQLAEAAGGWVSNVSELVSFLNSFDDWDPDLPGTDTDVLDWNSVQEMWEYSTVPTGSLQLGDYGLGWFMKDSGEPGNLVSTWYHGGGVYGTASMIIKRSDGVNMAILFNRNRGTASIHTPLNAAAQSIAVWP